MRAGSQTVQQALKPVMAKREPPVGIGDWLVGVVMGPTGIRQFRLFRPAGVRFGERLPLMVMLHGCQQDAKSFARQHPDERCGRARTFSGALPRAGSGLKRAGMLELV